ncbi:MAG: MerR family DNA-binding transcriptional regulator [Planctomycetota bacterium]|jgi:DNA-binding transcriptional MerR regulator
MLLNSQELSERLNMSESTIRLYKEQGLIPYVQAKPGGAVRYEYHAVVRALKRITKERLKKRKEHPQQPQG